MTPEEFMENHSRLQTALGKVSLNWGLISSGIVNLFAKIVELPRPKAIAIVYTIRDDQTRLKMVEAVLPFHSCDEEHRDYIKQVLSRVDYVRDLRNKLIHYEVSPPGDINPAIVPTPVTMWSESKNRLIQVPLEDIEGLADAMSYIGCALSTLYMWRPGHLLYPLRDLPQWRETVR